MGLGLVGRLPVTKPRPDKRSCIGGANKFGGARTLGSPRHDVTVNELWHALANGVPTLLGAIVGAWGGVQGQSVLGRRDQQTKREERGFARQATLLDEQRRAAVRLSVTVTAGARAMQTRFNQNQFGWTGFTADDLEQIDRATARLGVLSDEETRTAADELVKALVAYVEARFAEDKFPAIGEAENRLIASVNREQTRPVPHY